MKKTAILSVLVITIGLLFTHNPVAFAQSSTQPKEGSKSASKERLPIRNLAIFLFDGVQIIDYTGPYEVLGAAHNGTEHLFNVYTVAEKAGPITTNMGMTVIPKYTFDNMPKTEVLVLPGGNVSPQLSNEKVIKWVQDTTQKAEIVMSVCNGAFYLGKAGLLDGLPATTFAGLIDELRELAPKARVVTDQRFVDNGKIITTAGLTSGMDGALHLVERIVGRPRAEELALNLEYNWQPDQNFARASLADMHIRWVLGRAESILPEDADWKLLAHKGGKDEWVKTWQVRYNVTAPELLKLVDSKLSEKWTRVDAKSATARTRSTWRFSDHDGKAWQASTDVQPVSGQANTYNLTIRLARGEISANSR